MSPDFGACNIMLDRFPRVSGDEPATRPSRPGGAVFSPRERG